MIEWITRFVILASRNKMLTLGVVVFALIVMLAICAPIISVYNPNTSDHLSRLTPPSGKHFFGTDSFGRDIWARVLFGTRVTLRIAAAVVGVSGFLGTTLGLIGGYFARLNVLITSLINIMMTFPALLLAIAIVAVLGPGERNVVISLIIVLTPRIARIVRASTLQIRQALFIEAARSLGASHSRIILRHLLPNCAAPLLVQLTLSFAYTVLTEASLSFIGLGPQPPTPSLGGMLSEGRIYMRVAPWLITFPGLVIALIVLSVNLIGDGLRDQMDPRLRI